LSVSNNDVSLLGFRLAVKEADKEHPFGYDRYEYISGLVIVMLVFVVGFLSGKSGWMWWKQAAMLSYFHCLTVDLPGHGKKVDLPG